MKELESQRMKLWCDVFIAYVGAANSVNKEGAKNWADYAIKTFDERFKEEEEQKNPWGEIK